ncbi:hypothetical protein L1987_48673 [Smallanthus sonchifolius]|uniref:Uncharacterized protein n=1 Tax=Smallanthus sonchifolius TaxID=185202 RepID=A0ACB9FRY9_9ASTR|nr:hypothetical protein L1987_48673 [Smallanthus sonchifolius]
MVQRRRATACRRTCRLRFILSTPVLDMGGEDEPKVGMLALEQKIDQPMDEETGSKLFEKCSIDGFSTMVMIFVLFKNFMIGKNCLGGVCEVVAAVSWFLGIVSVTGERTELGFSPAAAPALSNDGA